MKRFALFVTTAVVLSTAVSLSSLKAAPLPTQKAPVRSLATMQVGEKTIISYKSQGCFHYRDYTLTFTAATPMTVKIEQHSDSADAEYREKATKRTATLTLSPEDVGGLDETINYYRSTPKGGCTTSDVISIAWYQNETGQKQESFVDRSCNLSDGQGLTFAALIDRILPPPT